MKLLKTLTVGAVAAAMMASHASAYTLIHVVGSTAFRTGTLIAIIDYLSGATAANYNKTTKVYAAYTSSSVAGAGQQIFANGYLGSTQPTGNANNPSPSAATIVVVTDWTGSAGGLVDLVDQHTSAQFLDDTTSAVQNALNAGLIDTSSYEYFATTVGGTETIAGPGGAATVAGPLTSTTAFPQIDMSMCDVNKTTISNEIGTATLSGTAGSFSTITSLASSIKGSAIKDAGTQGEAHVAICPFEWVVGSMTGSNGTNTYGDSSTPVAPTAMTQNAAEGLINSGFAAQGMFTGGTTDSDFSNFFYLVGRNEDSGSRIATLSEAQVGVTGGAVNQYQASTSAAQLFPATPLFTQATSTGTITWNSVGHSGYNSGGNVASALEIANGGKVTFTSGQAISSTSNSYFIGYLGLTDAAAALANGATGALSYNGYAFSEANVQHGQYSLWSYEHCYRNNSFSSNSAAVNTIADLIFAKDADVIYAAPPDNASGVSYSSGFSGGVTHAENSGTGAYSRGTLTFTASGASSATVVPLVSAGMFDDSFVDVLRSATSEGTPVPHK